MFEPEEQQIKICLLKSDLEEIEHDLIVQRSALPELDAENEKKYRETMAALKVVRSFNTEIEKLKQENIQLTAKRMQLKLRCDDINKDLETACAQRDTISNSLKQEEREIEQIIRKYEDSLEEKADRFRTTHKYYNKEEVDKEIDEINNVIAELKDDLGKKQSVVDELRARMDSIHPEVPEAVLEIIGKEELEEQVKSVNEKLNSLMEMRNNLAI